MTGGPWVASATTLGMRPANRRRMMARRVALGLRLVRLAATTMEAAAIVCSSSGGIFCSAALRQVQLLGHDGRQLWRGAKGHGCVSPRRRVIPTAARGAVRLSRRLLGWTRRVPLLWPRRRWQMVIRHICGDVCGGKRGRKPSQNRARCWRRRFLCDMCATGGRSPSPMSPRMVFPRPPRGMERAFLLPPPSRPLTPLGHSGTAHQCSRLQRRRNHGEARHLHSHRRPVLLRA